MGLKAKVHVTNHKTTAESWLAARLDMLKTKGLDDASIRKDSLIKKFKGAIYKANHQLATIANQEKQNMERAQTKAEKQAAKNNPPEMKVEPTKAESKTKPKKEKKTKEKKEKAAPSEG
ncbi:MAG: hypothetical protein JW829_16210 [Pirellulales bacterium]|nr:hypothetical protein [Pirellulales bacterium]